MRKRDVSVDPRRPDTEIRQFCDRRHVGVKRVHITIVHYDITFFLFILKCFFTLISVWNTRQFYSARVIAQIITHPMDVLKIRMQVSRDTLRNAALRTLSTNGVRGFYKGLSAGLLRQLTYTTSRLGIYTTLLDIGE